MRLLVMRAAGSIYCIMFARRLAGLWQLCLCTAVSRAAPSLKAAHYTPADAAHRERKVGS